VLVHWPRQVTDSLSAEAVAASSEVLVAPLVRRTANADAARVVARFADGAPAIVERLLDDGCIRDVAFDLPRTGDVPLRESVRRLVGVIAAPCETHEYRSAMTATRMDSLRGTGPLLSTAALARTSRERSAATSWLLIAGALILMIEVGLRQRTGTA
jgi:hypothetical protein